jgi:hypothetical protein
MEMRKLYFLLQGLNAGTVQRLPEPSWRRGYSLAFAPQLGHMKRKGEFVLGSLILQSGQFIFIIPWWCGEASSAEIIWAGL